MMFLQFFVWGAWYTSIAVYMTAEGMGDLTHWPFTVNPIAAIAAPFFLGLVADRYFSTEKVLGVLHVLGGLVLLTVPQFSGAPVVFVLLLLLYNLCFMPTLGLANSLAFHNIADQEKQFPLIRVFGTIGWIVAGLFVSLVLRMFMTGGSLPEQTPLPLYTAAVTSLVLGLYSFSLPHTPPPAAGERVSVRSILGLDALKALGSRPFYVFLGASLLISIPLAAYYNFTQLFLEATGFQNIAGTQTLGQMSEVIFMLLMPLFFVRLGVKWMLVAGMGAWALRYVFFALAAPSGVFWMIIVGRPGAGDAGAGHLRARNADRRSGGGQPLQRLPGRCGRADARPVARILVRPGGVCGRDHGRFCPALQRPGRSAQGRRHGRPGRVACDVFTVAGETKDLRVSDAVGAARGARGRILVVFPERAGAQVAA
jgi:nucleoside transporter